MRRGFKKTVALLLVCIMVVGILPGAALAEGASEQSNVSSWFLNIIQFVNESFNRDNLENNKESEKIETELVQSNQLVLDSKTLQATSIEGDYKYAEVDGGVAITAYTGVAENLTIPDSLGGKKVVEIGIGAFSEYYDYENERDIISVTIPEGVTTIGNEAFLWCYNLREINLPKSLSSIGDFAFSNCDSLISLSIPEGVTNLGRSAFSECDNLINVNLPKKITKLYSTFCECKNLKSVDIPLGVLKIDDGTFSGCVSLTSVNIPESVTYIGHYSFNNCTNLESIRLPESIVEIGVGAFSVCKSIKSIVIPEKVLKVGEYVLNGCVNLEYVQFNSKSTIIEETIYAHFEDSIPANTTIIGYDPSTAKDYATKYGNPFQLINDQPQEPEPGEDGIVAVSEKQLSFSIKDVDTKKGILGVTVNLDGKTATTGTYGIADYENPTAGEHAFTVQCPGYLDYESTVTVKKGGMVLIYLQKDTGDNKPYLTQVNLKKGSMAASDVRQYEKVFIGVSKESDLTDDDYGLVEMKANLRGQKLKRYILSQNGKAVMESTTGKFDRVALAEKFAAGSPIYAMVETQDGTCSRAVETKIKIMSASFKWGTEDSSGAINLGKSMGATIPSDLPVLGGTNINFGMDVIPATITVTPDHFKIALGVADMKDSVETWSSFRKTIDDAKSTSKASRMKDFKKLFKPKKIGMPITTGWEPEVDVMGYVEGIIIDGQPVVTKGTLILNAGASYSQQTQYIIGPVPVYLEVGAGLDLELMGEIARLVPESGEVKLTTELTITPNFELGGGVGIASVVTVGAAGKAELGLLRRFSDDYYKISLTGSMSLKAKALLFEAKKEIAKGTWVIKEGYGNQQSVNASETGTGMETFNIYDASQYSPMPRDYAQNPSPWSGESLSTQAITNTNQTLQVLQTNVFPNAQPRMATIGDSQVMIWTADNTGRTAANRTMLVYSVYNQSSQTWSTPAAVSDDGTADFYPQIGSDGSNLWVTWQNSKTTFADTATLAETASAGEIAVVRYNPATHAFEAPKTLTNNDTLDTQPQIAVSGDKAAVVWTSNSASDLFGTTGRNTISGAEYTGTWSEPKTWVDDQNAITGISLGYVNSTATAAYTLDGDNDLNTIDDRDLFTATPSQSVTRLTQDESLDANPLFALLNGVDTLFWYHNSNITYVPSSNLGGTPKTVFAEAPQGKGDAFNVISNKAGKTALIWTETKDAATEIHSVIYDENQSQWSNTIQISNLDSRVQFPCGVIDPNGNYKIAVNRQNAVEETTATCDLCVLGVTPATNLTLNDLSFSAEAVQPGGQLPVELDVTNTGQLTVDQLIIDVKDGDTLVQSIPLSETLKPGETRTLSVAIALPETISRKDYALSIRPATADDYDQQDNVKTLAIGYTDLALTLEETSSGSGTSITAALTNLSCIATDATLTVTEDTPDGGVLYTRDIKDIQNGTNLFDVIELETKDLTFSSDIKQLYVTITASGHEEISLGDNSEFIVIDNPNATENPEEPGQPGFVAFLGKDPNGTCYEYNATDLNNAYLAYQINPALPSAKMYQQFLTSQCRVIALKDGAKGYMDYNAAATASLMAQMKGEAFDINAYLAGAEAKQLEETVGMVKTVDKDGNIL